MKNKIVVHFTNGKIIKGTTEDLSPNECIFHIKENDSGATHELNTLDIKAVYFVKSFEGNSEYQDRDDIKRVGLGKKLIVHFRDGETLVGYSRSYNSDMDKFIMFPSDPESNIKKVFVIARQRSKMTLI
jgi:hypothetical protein